MVRVFLSFLLNFPTLFSFPSAFSYYGKASACSSSSSSSVHRCSFFVRCCYLFTQSRYLSVGCFPEVYVSIPWLSAETPILRTFRFFPINRLEISLNSTFL
ncbi:hypothetical protein EDD16DRAFT_298146 [Pisolithus croceorrhizus]|nr:hypothetical protein EDD16DRAFT_298146 [Pisolithus croceorrhizus]